MPAALHHQYITLPSCTPTKTITLPSFTQQKRATKHQTTRNANPDPDPSSALQRNFESLHPSCRRPVSTIPAIHVSNDWKLQSIHLLYIIW